MQGAADSIPGWGAKVSPASWPKNQNRKQKQYCNKLNKDFKNWSTLKKKIIKERKKEKISGILVAQALFVVVVARLSTSVAGRYACR